MSTIAQLLIEWRARMAGGGGGEEDSYWPGYVDALTTMTMVLTFIMMVLGVVVFMLSQNISRTLFEAIARAARIDMTGLAGKTYEEQRLAVLGALERRAERDGTAQIAAPAPGPPPIARPAVAEQAEESAPAERDLRLGAGKVLEERRSETAEAPRQGGAATEVGAGLRIAFAQGAITLGDGAAAELATYLRQSASGTFLVQANAVETGNGATDARRRAYYRAMLVRSQIAGNGVPADRITVRVRDASAGEDEAVVMVFGRNGRAAP
jgi:hypothetical protein